jgi:hypothetical protein
MKVAIFTLFVFTMLVITGCTNKSKADYIMFGDYYGFCAGDCVDYYKIEEGVLYTDQLNEYPSNNNNHSFTVYSNNYNASILDLVNEIPDSIYNEGEVVGSPDSFDQGGYYLEVHHNGNTTRWKIDKSNQYVPVYLHALCDSMEHYLQVLE